LSEFLPQAFSLHRLGRIREAFGIIQGLPPNELHDPHAAAHAALVLVEAVQLEAAKEYIAAAANGELYPEGKKLLDEAKTSFLATSATSPMSFAFI
jgi:hypothetical protein